MRPELEKAHLSLYEAKKQLREALAQEAKAVIALVGCRGCQAPKGRGCHKPSGQPTRPHAERRKDAEDL